MAGLALEPSISVGGGGLNFAIVEETVVLRERKKMGRGKSALLQKKKKEGGGMETFYSAVQNYLID